VEGLGDQLWEERLAREQIGIHRGILQSARRTQQLAHRVVAKEGGEQAADRRQEGHSGT
jgi:hypothetical protein